MDHTREVHTFEAIQNEALILLVIGNVIIETQVVLMAHGKPARPFTFNYSSQ